jgi:type IV secretory pathway VirB9-like protein
MRVLAVLVLCLLAGCAEPPPPPLVPPPPEDLSTWTVPEVVHPQPVPAAAEAPPVKEVPPTVAEKVYTYTRGGTYLAPVSLGFPLDIVFGPGEQVHTLTDGDRTPQEEGKARKWQVLQGEEGSGAQKRHHVFITASEAGLRNGLIVTTTKQTYYITLESMAKSPVRVLRWKEEAGPSEGTDRHPKEPSLLPDPAEPKRWHVGYVLASSQAQAPDWLPRVYDDGKKMYVLYPEVTLFAEVPLIRKIGPNGPQLINARQYLNVVILDELAGRLELRVGIGEQAEVVTVMRGRLRTIQCPDDAECPQFPAAAQHLAGRKP